jgi:transposase-like protein
MTWTHERLEALRASAADGKTVAEAAAALGLSRHQVRNAAWYYKIRLARRAGQWERERPAPTPEAELRARWEKILPELKASLVRQLERTA